MNCGMMDIPVDVLNCLNRPSYEQLQGFVMEGTNLSRASGNAEFDLTTLDTGTFSVVLDLSMFRPTYEIAVRALAQLDQDWATMPNNAFPKVPPQSHFVNVHGPIQISITKQLMARLFREDAIGFRHHKRIKSVT
jgi:hypothetical protein